MKRSVTLVAFTLFLGWTLWGAAGLAQFAPVTDVENGSRAIPVPAVVGAPAWGTQDLIVQAIPACDFDPTVNPSSWAYYGQGYRYGTQDPTHMDAPAILPDGATPQLVMSEICNDTPSIAMSLHFLECPYGANCADYYVLTPNTTGCYLFGIDLTSLNITIDNSTTSYFIRFGLHSANTAHRFRTARVYYKLQVSPPPATATFTDVPTTHPFFQYVEALAASGITSGCTATKFCPNAPLTRGQMAVFLSKALGLHW